MKSLKCREKEDRDLIKTRIKKIDKKNQKEGEAIKEGFKGKRETDQQIQEKEIYRRRLLV